MVNETVRISEEAVRLECLRLAISLGLDRPSEEIDVAEQYATFVLGRRKSLTESDYLAFEKTFEEWMGCFASNGFQNMESLSSGGVGDLRALADRAVMWAEQSCRASLMPPANP